MAAQVFATKGNLMAAKKSLVLAKMGYDLMDRKRNVLIREMMMLVDKVKLLRDEITDSYQEAYYLLQQANVSTGIITSIASQVKVDTGVRVTYRSVMGVEVPNIIYKPEDLEIQYGFEQSSSKVDEAYIQFNKVKELTMILAEVDNSVYRLANAIRKTQKRANALKNIVIPDFESQIKFITEALEEKEREEFSRLKVIKANKERDANQHKAN
ncbi:V-type ATP synthase subunit D [Anaerorhabdus furcosa]|uniref:V-type ATP synthase subunit D n=1 Tax=Anaerorhabdus furcosa TaxID=118967 RepID=A0A1T4PU38_9FIRM|nr:V-type ATP synthase subunit D [Anaerorhabdus furcosa]SJZ94448.1 V/A-type H+-transporting ATPase subunit D [Anaerorhabdus furcosa]